MRYFWLLFFIIFVLALSFSTKLGFVEDYIFPYQEKTDKNAKILFGGDMMFDRHIRKMMQKNGDDYIFSCIKDKLQEADLVVANLEGPITINQSVSVDSVPAGENNYTFTFSPLVAGLLKKAGVGAVNLGNNHITNFGNEGVIETLRSLDEAGVGYFGDPFIYKTFEKNINGVMFSFISYNQFGGEAEDVLSKIKKARQDGLLPVVYTHWGNEYEMFQPELIDLAHSFVDAGAEAVVGSHPHVVGEVEVYKEKPIFYSLGNFIFDQYFDENVRSGLMVEMNFDATGLVSYKELPIEMFRDGRTCFK